MFSLLVFEWAVTLLEITNYLGSDKLSIERITVGYSGNRKNIIDLPPGWVGHKRTSSLFCKLV